MKSNLQKLNATDFENLVYDLVVLEGLRNVKWRTPGRDAGRDIEGEFVITDFSGEMRNETWYVECKKHSQAISWPTVWEKISYAESQNADFLLVVTTSTLSPRCIDELNKWNASNRKPKLRHWGFHEFISRINRFPLLLIKYHLGSKERDRAAWSLLSISELANKFTSAAYTATIFNADPQDLLETSAALSDLLSRKIEQIERYGKIVNEAVRIDRDIYDWLESKDVEKNLSLFDRYVFRALMATYKILTKSDLLEIKSNNQKTLTVIPSHNYPLLQNQEGDLHQIGVWGNVEVSVIPNGIQLKQR